MGELFGALKLAFTEVKAISGVSKLGAGGLKKTLGHNMIPLMGALTVVQPLAFGKGPMSERVKQAGVNAATTLMTMGMASQLGQGAWNFAFMTIPQMPGMFRGLATRYRSGLDARTSAAIPFSHSTLPMDQALASLSYAQSRMGDLGRGTEFNWTAGNTAAFMAARYMSR